MRKFLLSMLFMLTLGFAGQAEDLVYEVNTNIGSWMPEGSNATVVEKTAPDGQKFTFGKDAYYNTGGYLFIKKGGYISTALPINCSKIILHTTSGQGSSCSINILVNQDAICDAQTMEQNKDFTYLIPEGYQSSGTEYFIKNVSSQSKNAQITKITFVDAGGEVSPSYPTECAAPVFSIDGSKIDGTTATAYAGSKISVSCTTPNATTDWKVNNDLISGAEYVIPTDANVGDVYTFWAQSKVQGETAMIESGTTDLVITVAEMPLEGYFYTSDNIPTDDKSSFATEFTNESTSATNTHGGLNEKSFTSNLVTVEFTSETASSGTKYYPYVNSKGELKIYHSNSLYISVPDGYSLISINSTHTISNLTLDTKEAAFTDAHTISFNGNISKVKITNPDNSMTFCKTLTVRYKKNVVATAVPEVAASDEFLIESGVLSSSAESVNVKLATTEGIDIYYKITKAGGVDQPQTLAAEDHTHAGFTKYDSNTGITLTNTDTSLEYFACDAANGVDSDHVTLSLQIGPTGVGEIEAAEAGEVRWFDMQGREVKGQPESGIYVRVINGKASKVIVK